MGVPSDYAGKELCAAVGKQVREFSMSLSLDEVVVVRIAYLPDAEELARLKVVFEKYGELAEREV